VRYRSTRAAADRTYVEFGFRVTIVRTDEPPHVRWWRVGGRVWDGTPPWLIVDPVLVGGLRATTAPVYLGETVRWHHIKASGCRHRINTSVFNV
jgi:hypothetical protein